MSRTSTLIFFGILIILIPFTGFPSSIRALLDVVLGATVFAIGLSMRSSETKPAPLNQEPSSIA